MKSRIHFGCTLLTVFLISLFAACSGDDQQNQGTVIRYGYPDFCKEVPPVNTELYPEGMCKYAAAYCVGQDGGLASHEWPKHGSCTTLAQETFYAEILRLAEYVDGLEGSHLIYDNIGGSVELSVVQDAYGGPSMVSLGCDKECNLVTISTCYSVGPDGTVGEREACGNDVLSSGYDNGCQLNNCQKVNIVFSGECDHTGGSTSDLGNKYEGLSGAAPGDFEQYQFAMIWASRYCCDISTDDAAACEYFKDNPEAYGNTHWTVHGLWPNFNPARIGIGK